MYRHLSEHNFSGIIVVVKRPKTTAFTLIVYYGQFRTNSENRGNRG